MLKLFHVHSATNVSGDEVPGQTLVKQSIREKAGVFFLPC